MLITQDDNHRTLHCAVRETVTLRLPGNPSTGYAWNCVGRAMGSVAGDDSTLVLVRRFTRFEAGRGHGHDHLAVPSSSHSARLGAVGVYEFKFTPLVAGKHTVKLVYSQPWNAEMGLVDPEDRFVVVLDASA